jgi:phosphoribosylcarboxyaminoimidazole (NCAIR) mutase
MPRRLRVAAVEITAGVTIGSLAASLATSAALGAASMLSAAEAAVVRSRLDADLQGAVGRVADHLWRHARRRRRPVHGGVEAAEPG